MNVYIYFLIGIVAVFILAGIRIVRPTHRGVVERLGKYNRLCSPGFNWIIPVIEVIRYRNITERMTNVQPQDIITKDNLNARVDLVVYHKVKDTETDIMKSYYNVDDYKIQIIMLAQTTARNVIGDMKFVEVNNQRNVLNKKLAEIIDKEISEWGISVVRVELKEITPPADVQETMNRVIKAQNEKEAAIDFATATETKADGEKRAEIKKAEGENQAKILMAEAERQKSILVAEGQAKAFELINNSFKGNAQLLKQLEVTQATLENNAKIVITERGISPTLVLGDSNVIPIEKRPKK